MPESGLPIKPHFVLVHGIGGGSWCWYKIRCLMENSGYKVSCIDLKSAGIDQTDVDSVLTFDDYNKPLIEFLSALPENEQVILVYYLKFRNNLHKIEMKGSFVISINCYFSGDFGRT